MAMKESHTPVRINDSLYNEIKQFSDSLGLPIKRSVEMLLTKSLNDIKKSDSINMNILRSGKDYKIELQ